MRGIEGNGATGPSPTAGCQQDDLMGLRGWGDIPPLVTTGETDARQPSVPLVGWGEYVDASCGLVDAADNIALLGGGVGVTVPTWCLELLPPTALWTGGTELHAAAVGAVTCTGMASCTGVFPRMGWLGVLPRGGGARITGNAHGGCVSFTVSMETRRDTGPEGILYTGLADSVVSGASCRFGTVSRSCGG